jgi:hypothetical protein
VLALVLPIAAAASLVAVELTARERERADARLAVALRAADAELSTILDAAESDASGLARTPAVRAAVLRGDTAAVARLARTFPGLVVRAHGRLLTRPLPGDALARAVAVIDGGTKVGDLGIATHLDHALLLRLQRRAHVALLFERAGRVIAGASVRAGGSIELTGARAQSVIVDNDRFRAVVARVDARFRLVALLPARVIEAAEDRQVRIVALVAALSLFVLVVAADAVAAFVRRRRR